MSFPPMGRGVSGMKVKVYLDGCWQLEIEVRIGEEEEGRREEERREGGRRRKKRMDRVNI